MASSVQQLVKESNEDPNQKNTILNLFNSGLEPETISLELDIDEDIVKTIIEREKNKEKTRKNRQQYF